MVIIKNNYKIMIYPTVNTAWSVQQYHKSLKNFMSKSQRREIAHLF